MKLPSIGDEIVGALTGVDVMPEMRVGSKPPVQAVNQDGKPKMQDVVTGSGISCGGGEVGTVDSRRTPEPGEPVEPGDPGEPGGRGEPGGPGEHGEPGAIDTGWPGWRGEPGAPGERGERSEPG